MMAMETMISSSVDVLPNNTRFLQKVLSFNERVAGSIKAIHVGNVYGTFTKIIYFLACLIATSLPITGTMIWINKMKKSKKKNKAVRKETISAPAVA